MTTQNHTVTYDDDWVDLVGAFSIGNGDTWGFESSEDVELAETASNTAPADSFRGQRLSAPNTSRLGDKLQWTRESSAYLWARQVAGPESGAVIVAGEA